MTLSQLIQKDWISLLWFFSTIVLIVFLVRRGWQMMPPWQRNYVPCAVVIVPAFEIGQFLPIPGSGPIYFTFVILYLVNAFVTWWGIVVGIGQTWALLRPANSN